jgi:hypothetical protein
MRHNTPITDIFIDHERHVQASIIQHFLFSRRIENRRIPENYPSRPDKFLKATFHSDAGVRMLPLLASL